MYRKRSEDSKFYIFMSEKERVGDEFVLFSHVKTERYQMKLLGSSLKANKRKHFSIQHVIKPQNSSKCACSAWAPEIMKLIEETFSKDYPTETLNTFKNGDFTTCLGDV